MIRILIVISLCLLLFGCGVYGHTTTLICQDYALAGAYADRRVGYEVRIMVEPWVHSQHQAKINGKWVYRHVGLNSVYTSTQDHFTPTKVHTIEEYIAKNTGGYSTWLLNDYP
jgi:hypothetical protein